MSSLRWVTTSLCLAVSLWGCASGARTTDASAASRPAFVTVRVGAGADAGAAGYELLVGTTEVTQREWRERMGTDPSFQRRCDDCPVERVSWYDAAAYANALSEAEGLEPCYELDACASPPRSRRGPGTMDGLSARVGLECQSVRVVGPSCEDYRLPTVEEWDTFGPVAAIVEDPESARDYAAFRRLGRGLVRRVAGRRPNEHGLHDTVGNVEEWLETRAHTPTEQTRWQRRVALQVWFLATGACFHSRASALHPRHLHYQLGAFGRNCLGFRVVRTLLRTEPSSTAPAT